MSFLECADESRELWIALDLAVNLRNEFSTLFAQPVGREDEPRRRANTLDRCDCGDGICGIGQVMRNEQDEPSCRMPELLKSVFDEVKGICGNLRAGLPHRHRFREFGAIAAHGDANRPSVRNRHGDGVHPRRRLYLEPLDQFEHCRRESLPLEVRLVPRQEQERHVKLVLSEIQIESSWSIVAQVVLIEKDRGAPSAIVQERVAVELCDRAVFDGVEQVLAQLRDGSACIRESSECRDQVQAKRNLHDVCREVVKSGRIAHGSTLTTCVERQVGLASAVSEHRERALRDGKATIAG